MLDGKPGTVVELDPMDSLGWIELDGGGRVRFGGTALHGFVDVPGPGARVRVIGTKPGFRGALKAERVVPFDFEEKEDEPVDTRAALAALKLDVSLARDDWEETLAELVEHYAVGSAACDRDRAVALDGEDEDDVRALLERWLGERIPADAEDLITHAADVLLIRAEHGLGAGDGRQLFEIEGEAGSLFVVRTWAEREAAEAVADVRFSTCHYPDTESALSGIYRYEGARRSFVAHAPACSLCQAQLRAVIDQYGRDSITGDFLALLRG